MAEKTGIRLTKRVVDQADPSRGRHYLWDGELKGFGIQVEPSGTKTYIVRYRPKGLGRSGPRRFMKIGRHGQVTADEARSSARSILGRVASGEDPATDAASKRAAFERDQNALTVGELGERFLAEHVRVHRRPLTALNYEILLRRHVAPAIGDRPAVDISREDVRRLHSKMGPSANANRMLAFLSSMYAFAAKRGLVEEGTNPARGIDKFREEGRERYLTTEELRRLGLALDEAETIGLPWLIDPTNPKSKHTPKHYKDQRQVADADAVAAIRLLLFTGARLREILHLRWRHVDLDRGLLFLPTSKTGKKTIVLNGPAMEVLVTLIRRGHGDGDRPPVADQVVIRGKSDVTPRADLKRPWEAIRRQAQLDGVRLHDLRHTFASIGAGASLGLPIVGKLLGHAQPQTTARYAHLDADPLRRAADTIGDLLSGALSPKDRAGRDG